MTKNFDDALLNTLFEHVGDAIEVTDTNLRIAYVNPAFEHITGYDRSDVIGRTPASLLRPEDADPDLYEGVVRAIESGQVWKGELVARRKDGSLWIVDATMSPLRDATGEITRYVAIKRDVTDRRHAEAALRESEQRFKDFANTASDWFWESDAEHRFTKFSDESEHHAEYWARARAGKTRFDARIAEDTDDAKWEAHRAELDAHRPFKDFQYPARGVDGAIHHVRVSGNPIFSADGEFRGYRGTASDITDFVEADERARSAQDRLASAIEGLSETFLLFDTEDRLVIGNWTWRELNRPIADHIRPGATLEDILRASIRAGLLPGARGQEEEWLRARLERHRNPKGPFEIERAEGRWALVNDHRLPDGGIITVGTDITDLKRTEDALRESEARAEQAHTRLVDAIESLHEGFMMLDSDDQLVMSNKRLLEMYAKLAHLYVPGTTYEDITRGVAESGLVPQARGREDEWFRERIERYKNPGPPFERQLGPDLWVLTSERKTSDGGTVVVHTDITEMKRRAFELEDTKERFRRLLEMTNAIPWEADARTWLFTYVGPQMVELLGYPRKLWLGKDFWAEHIHPEDRAKTLADCLEFSTQRENYDFEYRMIASDGRTVWLQDIVNVVKQDGEPVILRGFMIDITERKSLEESQRNLSVRLINAHEEERMRISRELHDDFSQRLALLAVGIQQLGKTMSEPESEAAKSTDKLWTLTQEISTDLHRLSHQLHPAMLDQLGLVPAIRSLCDEISQQHDIEIKFSDHEIPTTISPDIALCLYRAVQEGLSNIVKHSGAKDGKVELTGGPDMIELSISDRGVGFDPKTTNGVGLGLVSIRERVHLLKGKALLQSRSSRGTRIDIGIPLALPDISPSIAP